MLICLTVAPEHTKAPGKSHQWITWFTQIAVLIFIPVGNLEYPLDISEEF